MLAGILIRKNLKQPVKIAENVFFAYRSQIKKSPWLVNEMGREWPNLSFKQLKLDLETENWLKAEKPKFGGRAATTFASRNLKIENFS